VRIAQLHGRFPYDWTNAFLPRAKKRIDTWHGLSPGVVSLWPGPRPRSRDSYDGL